jgi:hypothetical protein
MPEDKSQFTLVVDRTNASSKNQDVELMKHISEIFQVAHPSPSLDLSHSLLSRLRLTFLDDCTAP